MSFTKVQIIHMVVEAILIVGLAAFVIVRTKQQSAKISELENELRIQKSRTDVLEAVVQEILRGQHSTVKQRVAQVVQNVRPTNNQRPVQVQARPVQQEMQQAPPPPPPRANPLESMMAMMAPMMSSLVIGGDDDGPEANVEINEEPEVDDSEIAEELGDLKEEIEVEEVVSGGEEATGEVTGDSTSSNAENVGEQIDNEIEEEIAALEEDEEDK
jgi:hypothetical protein